MLSCFHLPHYSGFSQPGCLDVTLTRLMTCVTPAVLQIPIDVMPREFINHIYSFPGTARCKSVLINIC